ncbi:MAG: hypothetical protein ACRD5W_13960, partial [Candidatus Acidiferrales bacterium]
IPGKALFGPPMRVMDWDVDDPYGEDMATYRRICEQIEEQIVELAEELRREASPANPAPK